MIARCYWPLLALVGARNQRLSPVQMQKVLFLIGEEFGEQLGTDFYQFEPYHYGPYDRRVNVDVEALESQGLVRMESSGAHASRDYELTPAGEELAREFLGELDGRHQKYVAAIVKWVQSLSFRDLVTAIYKAFPRMREKSVFREPE